MISVTLPADDNDFSHLASRSPDVDEVTESDGDRAASVQSPLQSPQNPCFPGGGDRVTDRPPPEERETEAGMDACKTLEEAGLIRAVCVADAIGRRPKNYEVNPSILGSGA